MRQYLSSVFPDADGLLKVSGKDYHYFHQVLRVRAGDMVTVRFPDTRLQNMTVCGTSGEGNVLTLQVCEDSDTIRTVTRGTSAAEASFSSAKVEYWLFQFIAKPQKMDIIIRQATECGVHTIVPVYGDYTQAGKAAGARTDRAERIIREARQQSGSPVATRYVQPVTIQEAVLLWNEHVREYPCQAGFVLYERTDGTEPLYGVLSRNPHICTASLVVGSEGGISPSEIGILKAGGFVPVHFSTNILRCETAALYGLAVLQSAVTEIQECQYKE